MRMGEYHERDLPDNSCEVVTNLVVFFRLERPPHIELSVRIERRNREIGAAGLRAHLRGASSKVRHHVRVIGYGGGKALDTAKYVSHLAQLPFLAVRA
jgi:hypothetical protein